MNLPHISGANPKKIAEFSEKLNYSVQALETLKRLKDVQGNVSMTLDKLPAIRGDLVRDDPDWENWDFVNLPKRSNSGPSEILFTKRRQMHSLGKLGSMVRFFIRKQQRYVSTAKGNTRRGSAQ